MQRQVLKRLPLFAAFFGWPPREVWALTTDEWVLLARTVDDIAEDRRG